MAESEFSGVWWKFPPLRNALLAGILAGAAFILERLDARRDRGVRGDTARRMALGSRRRGKFVAEREVGIDILMLAATAGAALLHHCVGCGDAQRRHRRPDRGHCIDPAGAAHLRRTSCEAKGK
jgi:hypothetical protein